MIQAYLPELLGEDETKKLVEETAAELGLASKKDIGALMKAIMAQHKGRVDGKLVQRLAAEVLS